MMTFFLCRKVGRFREVSVGISHESVWKEARAHRNYLHPSIMPTAPMLMKTQSSMVRAVGRYEQELQDAHAESDELRSQLKRMAASATQRVAALKEQLQNDLEHIRQQEEEVAQWQIDLLSAELREAERKLQPDGELTMEALRARLQQNRRCRKALSFWHELGRQHRRRRRVVAAITPMGRVSRQALNSWMAMAEQGRIMRRALSSLAHKSERAAFNRWAEVAMDHGYHMMTLRRSLSALRNHSLRTSFNGWLEHTTQAANRLRRMKSSLTALRGSDTLKGWRSWVAAAASRQQMIRAASSVVFRTRRQAFETWHAFWHISARERNRMKGVLKVMSADGRACRRALNVWVALTQIKSTMHRALMSALHRAERAALNAWLFSAKQQINQIAMARRSLAAFCNAVLRVSLNEWIQYAKQSSRAHQILKVAATSFLGVGSRKAWMSWCGMRREKQQMAYAAQTFILRSRREAFERWLELCSSLVEERKKLRGIIRSLSPDGKALRTALNTWANFAQHALIAFRALCAVTRRKERAALNTWIETAVSRNAIVLKLSRGLASMRNSGLRFGLNAWMHRSNEATEANRRFNSAISAFGNRGTKRALIAWIAVASSKRHVATAMRRVIMAIRHKAEHSALTTWMSMAVEHGRRLTMIRRSLASLCNASMRAGFNSWLHHAEKTRRAKLQLISALTAMAGSGVRKAWQTWLHAVSRSQTMSDAAHTIFVRSVRQAWQSWLHYLDTVAETRCQLRRVLTGLSPKGMAMRRALNSWSILAQQRSSMLRAATSITRRCERAAFNQWFSRAQRQAASTSQLRRCLASFRHSGLRTGLNSWTYLYEQNLEAKRRLKSACVALSGSGVRRAWMSLREVVKERQRM